MVPLVFLTIHYYTHCHQTKPYTNLPLFFFFSLNSTTKLSITSYHCVCFCSPFNLILWRVTNSNSNSNGVFSLYQTILNRRSLCLRFYQFRSSISLSRLSPTLAPSSSSQETPSVLSLFVNSFIFS